MATMLLLHRVSQETCVAGLSVDCTGLYERAGEISEV